MAASDSPDSSQSTPEGITVNPSPEGEQEMLPLPLWDASTAADYREKYLRYQAAYARRLKSKYFSRKNLDGEDIFDQETNIEGEIIKSGRWPCTKSFIDQTHSSQDAGALMPARKLHPKKNE